MDKKEWVNHLYEKEKEKKKDDDTRILATLQVYAYVVAINFFSLKVMGKLIKPEQGFAFAFVLISFIIWGIALYLWRKSFFGYQYDREKTLEEWNQREVELREHYTKPLREKDEIEILVNKWLLKEIHDGIEKVTNSYMKNNNTRTEIFSKSNKLIFSSFLISLIAPLILGITTNFFKDESNSITPSINSERNLEETPTKINNTIIINGTQYESLLKKNNENTKNIRIIQEEIEDLQRYIK